MSTKGNGPQGKDIRKKTAPRKVLHKKNLPQKHRPTEDGPGHTSHNEAILRLKRATGHLNSVIQMIEEHRPCVDVVQQLSAVISALGSTRVLLLQDHLNTCISPLLKPDQKELLKELDVVIQRSMKL